MDASFEKSYHYPLISRVRTIFWLTVSVWFFLTGIYFLVTQPPASLNAWLGMSVAVALFGAYGIWLGRQQLLLISTIHLSQSGIHVRRFDDEVLSIAWTEIDEVRAKGRWGDFEVRCNREDKTIRVDRRLVGLKDLRNTIRAKTGQ